MEPLFTVGIPVYNEETLLEVNLRRLLGFLGSAGPSFEVLVGSNGSTDQTVSILEQLAADEPRIRYCVEEHRGPGKVFRTFLETARSDRLISLDMDLSVELDFVPRTLRLLESHDLVVGSKQTGEQKRSLIRKAGSGTFVGVARALLGLGFHDYSMAAKGYRVSALRTHMDRLVDGTAYVLYAIDAVQRSGGRIAEIPVACEDHRRSRFHLGHEAVHKFGHLFRLVAERRLRRSAGA